MALKRYLLLLLLFAPTLWAAERPLVVTTIQPLALLVEELLPEGVEQQTLLSGVLSPHDYQLKPSDLFTLRRADLVVWVGPTLESFLIKPLAQLDQQRVATLLPSETEEEHTAHHDSDHHHHEGDDPHIWLDPLRVIEMVEQLATHMEQTWPEQSGGIEQRKLAMIERLTKLDQQIVEMLEGPKAGYLVLHDGYRHFEERYGVKHRAYLAISPERPPGARHVWQLQRLLDRGEISCVFREPQFQPSILDRLLEGREVRVVELDPLASSGDFTAVDETSQWSGFSGYLYDFAQRFSGCVVQSSH